MTAHVAFNVTQVTEAGTTVLRVLVRDSLTIAGLLAWMIYINWKLMLIVLVMAPVIALIVKTVSRRLRTHEIEAEVGGTVTRILVENGQPVEYGQPLFIIE